MGEWNVAEAFREHIPVVTFSGSKYKVNCLLSCYVIEMVSLNDRFVKILGIKPT